LNFFKKKAKEGTSPVNRLYNCLGGLNMGSFPIILKFDSLGQYFFLSLPYISITTYIHIFFKNKKNIIFTNKLTTSLSRNLLDRNFSGVLLQPLFFNTLKNKLDGLALLLNTVFSLNKNIIVLDYNYNYNYLPIQQIDLFNSSDYNLHKIVKYFNVNCILFLNLSMKKRIFKRFLNLKLINIVVADTIPQKKFDFNITIGNNPFYHYIIYTFVLSTYYKKINK